MGQIDMILTNETNEAMLKSEIFVQEIFMKAPIAMLVLSGIDYKVEIVNELMLLLNRKPNKM